MYADLETINISELGDVEIVERMRIFNYEKYKTLVRMHLSFELDLNTDEFDLPCHEIAYEDKGKLKKWNRLSKKHKSTATLCSASAKSAGNSPNEGLQQQIDPGFMFHLKELKAFLMSEKSLKQEGIFRKTGSVSRQNELRLQIQNEHTIDLEASGYSAHDCATVFKSYLAELTEPVLTDAHYPAHLQIAPLCIGRSFNSNSSTLTRPPNPERIKREQRLLQSMQLLLLLLPDENRSLLGHIIEILHAVANMEHINKMSADNLATIFAPHLICPRNLPPEALHYLAKKLSSIIAYMIMKGADIFQIPAKLSTDIRAYLLERKRKKTMSPEQTLDESISDMSTVNTVYTFVDRERTAKCNTKNTTDTELAQLYAHIQSLPESSKKRRLIKQFNKQNGQGTPLQLVIMNRLKNSEASRSAKSFGDSIKKHIFHKSIISRTPKRGSSATPVGVETPNLSNNKQPKLRVLFQSPSTSSCTGSGAVTPESLHGKTTTLPNVSSTNTPYALNTHPLQKSVSSSSLLLNSSHNAHYINQRSTSKITKDENDSHLSSSSSLTHNNNDGLPKPNSVIIGSSISAPVSRQTSRDLQITADSMRPKLYSLNTSNASLASSSSSSSSSTTSSKNFPILDENCCVTPLKLISEAAKQLIAGGGGGGGGGGSCIDKKTVAWEDRILEMDENTESSTTLLQNNSIKELKSRYNSEPNLSHLYQEKLPDIPETLPEHQQTRLNAGASSTGVSLRRKLIKGVSMSNLKFPFTTPESTKRLVRSVSSTLKRRHSDDSQTTNYRTNIEIKLPLIEHDQNSFDDLDDETFEDDPNDHLDSDSETESELNEKDATLESNVYVNSGTNSTSSDMPDIGSGGVCSHMLVQPSGLYRNIDLITSTPASLLLGRRSMSPITKSAQRMPRSMQESIMTPRSRKPVMVLTTTLGSSDQNQTIYQSDLSSFREQDEDNFKCLDPPNLQSDNAISVSSYIDLLDKQSKEIQQPTNQECSEKANSGSSESIENIASCKSGVLSDNFKQYLRTRSVLTDSEPVDSSFSSHPDDFGDEDDGDNYNEDTDYESAHEIVDLNESQLSPSLLFCLDGNEPKELETCTTEGANNGEHLTEIFSTPPSHLTAKRGHLSRRDTYKKNNSNNVRKRAATYETLKVSSNSSDNNEVDNITQISDGANKENENCVNDYLSSKKILISEFPNETSF